MSALVGSACAIGSALFAGVIDLIDTRIGCRLPRYPMNPAEGAC
jgi:hypothetical protein